MSRILAFIKGAGMGAGLAFFFDPAGGRRRRALVRDQFNHYAHLLERALDKSVRDFENRACGLKAGLLGALTCRKTADDVLEARVRSKLGRYVSHPRTIEVFADGGHVVLCGPILADEVQPLIAAVRGVPGVQSVENNLQIHHDARDEPALLGGTRPPGERWNIAEQNWAPGTRLSLIAAGGALLAFGLTRRFPAASILGSIGLASCLAGALRGVHLGAEPSPRQRAPHPPRAPSATPRIPPSRDTAHELERTAPQQHPAARS